MSWQFADWKLSVHKRERQQYHSHASAEAKRFHSCLILVLYALRRGSTTSPLMCPIFDGVSAAREESIFSKSGQHDDWSLFASRDQPREWLYVARRPRPRRHLATRKRPSHGGCRLDFLGGGQSQGGDVDEEDCKKNPLASGLPRT